MPTTNRDDIPTLIRRFQNGERAALARLLTLVGNGVEHDKLATILRSDTSAAPVIALTGSGGVGKSSLLRQLTRHFAEQGDRVAVLACDPESPVTGGALLGDRCRIAETAASDRIFVRSLSTDSGRQGVAGNIGRMLQLIRAFGFGRIFVETVGAGQGDVAVRQIADIIVLVLQPQTGDALQWEKAGILELADLVVVNKADLSGADQTVVDLTNQMRSSSGQSVPIVKTSVARNEGIAELCGAIEQVLLRCRNRRPTQEGTVVAEQEDKVSGRQFLRTTTDPLLEQIADYICQEFEFTDEAWRTARLCLLDSLGCGLLALNYPECRKLLGPVVPGATCPGGARVPGMSLELDPVTAAFNIGSIIRWLDYNDTWLAAEWGHPSDNFGGILAVADYLNRSRSKQLTVRDALDAAIRAYEIQGVLALENAFNRIGLDHVILVRIATTAVVTRMLGGNRQQVMDAVSNAWLDGGALRSYRHAPNTGSRKSWAAGDATRRGVQLSLWTMSGEMGYATALSAPKWGFQDVLLDGQPVVVNRLFGNYVMENVLFKVAFPAEFHAQTAAEAAILLHDQVAARLTDIDRIHIETQESAIRIINKTGPLTNPADRDHCLQYIVAVGLIHGALNSDHYEETAAADPRIDQLRDRMDVVEVPRYSHDYLDPEKRSIANAVRVQFSDGTSTDRVEVEYPLGHRRRRSEAIPMLREKFRRNAETRLPADRVQELIDRFFDSERIDGVSIDDFIQEFVPPPSN